MSQLSVARARVFFLPGAWHGSWCWTKHITPLLSKLKYECIPIDYPRKFYPDSPATFNDYVNHSTDIIQQKYQQDTSKPNVIVGHSLGGLIGTNVTEKVMTEHGININGFIHISSCALLDGENLIDNGVEHPLFVSENTQKLADSVNVIEGKNGEKWSELKPECVQDLFYHDCPPQDIELAKKELVPEMEFDRDCVARWPSSDGYKRVNKLYIECVNDNALNIELQREYWNKLGLRRERYEVISMDTSHSPFFAAPVTLTAHLDEWMVSKIRPKAY